MRPFSMALMASCAGATAAMLILEPALLIGAAAVCLIVTWTMKGTPQ